MPTTQKKKDRAASPVRPSRAPRAAEERAFALLLFSQPGELSLDRTPVHIKKDDLILLDLRAERLPADGGTPPRRILYLSEEEVFDAAGSAPAHGVPCRPADASKTLRIFDEIEQERAEKKPFYQELCALKLRELFILIARNGGGRPTDRRTAERFYRLRGELQKTPERLPSVEDMAASVNLSVSRFHSLYKELFGVSPKKDCLMMRVGRAKELLRDGGVSVNEAALFLGYTNPFHFIRQFKDAVGVTPGQYMRAAGKQRESIN